MNQNHAYTKEDKDQIKDETNLPISSNTEACKLET